MESHILIDKKVLEIIMKLHGQGNGNLAVNYLEMKFGFSPLEAGFCYAELVKDEKNCFSLSQISF